MKNVFHIVNLQTNAQIGDILCHWGHISLKTLSLSLAYFNFIHHSTILTCTSVKTVNRHCLNVSTTENVEIRIDLTVEIYSYSLICAHDGFYALKWVVNENEMVSKMFNRKLIKSHGMLYLRASVMTVVPLVFATHVTVCCCVSVWFGVHTVCIDGIGMRKDEM